MSAFQFYIELEDSEPLVWRRIQVPEDYTFFQFHLAIQGSFGWFNEHIFQFGENNPMTDKEVIGVPMPGWEYDWIVKNAWKIKLSSVFKRPGKALWYEYDLGDSWVHRIRFENKVGEQLGRPFCLEGNGACPPENVGGIDGYKTMLQVFNTPRHPDLCSYKQWLGLSKGEKWKPDYCSIREANARLAMLVKWGEH